VYVQSMEIDLQGRMWIIDCGRQNFLSTTAPVVNGQARILVYDIDGDTLIHTYAFPDTVASFTANFLNDIVLDVPRGFAYISDAGTGAVVVYDYNTDTSRRVVTPGMAVETELFTILGVAYNLTTPADGIALSPDTDTLYFCPLAGYHLHSVPTADLRDFSLDLATISSHTVDQGPKTSNSDGLVFSESGVLYYGLLTDNGVEYWNTSLGALAAHQTTIPTTINATTHNWVDTLGFDEAGDLIYTSNRLQLYIFNNMDFTGASGANFRVFQLHVGERSYLHAQQNSSSAHPTASLSASLWALGVAVVVALASLLWR